MQPESEPQRRNEQTPLPSIRNFDGSPLQMLSEDYVRNETPICQELNMLARERQLLERERDLIRRERELLTYERNVSNTSTNHTTVNSEILEKSFPEFDPGNSTGLNAIQWIRKVEGLADLYDWDDRTLLYCAMTKLKGAAKFWLDGIQQRITNWRAFRDELERSFPTFLDDVDVHRNLSTRMKKVNESYECYIYEMKAISSHGNVTEHSVIKYIIKGLHDKELAKLLAMQPYTTIQDLLVRIKQYEATMTQVPITKPTQVQVNPSFNRQRQYPVTVTRCYNCNETGHISLNCNKPQRRVRCEKCKKVGHTSEKCGNGNNTYVHQIQTKSRTDEYHKIVDIDGHKIIAFIDLGSDTVTMKTSIAKENNIKYVPESKRILGFGQGSCNSVGRRNLLIEIDGIMISVDVLMVPDEAQDVPIIIGRSALDQPDIKITKEAGKLLIERVKIQKSDETKNENSDVVVRKIKIDESLIQVNPELEEANKQELCDKLLEFPECFATEFKDVGKTDLAEMKIELTNEQPIICRPYRLPYAKREIVNNMIKELLDAGIVSESKSEYASPVLLVHKKTGDERLCVDFRKLNAVTRKENVQMPIIDEQLDKLSGNKYFTTLDLASGYYQIPIARESRHYTSFVTTDGQYQFNYMPFGLQNAPSVFNRLMTAVAKKIGPDVSVYMDDILVPSKTIVEGIQKLSRVLCVLKECKLTLKISKCRFLYDKVEYLGYEVDEKGVRPGKLKTDAICKFKRPENVHEVRQFIGLASFFRRFIADFAQINKPLTQLLKKDQIFEWGDPQEVAFCELKKLLTDRPILTLYDAKANHELHTDASKIGLSAILLQKHEDGLKAVAYYSRQTTEAEMKYHSYELEVLAVVEGLERFRIYLLGRKFKIVTDCNSMCALKNQKVLVPRIGRWWLKIQEYDFEIEHRQAERMKHADCLSRNPNEPPREMEVADLQVLRLQIDQDDWLLTMQLQDEKLKKIHDVLQQKPIDNDGKQIHHDYILENNRIYRKIEGEKRWVVPQGTVWKVIRGSHDDMGHFGFDKTIRHLKKHFWFPSMTKSVQKYLAACVECAYKASRGKPEGKLHNIERLPIPFYTVNVDHLGPFPKSARGNAHIIVYVDNFTKYVILKAVKDTKTKHVCAFLEEVFAIFGPPRRLISDRGTAFTSRDFENFCENNNVQHIKIATATPRANGQVERINRTVSNAITTSYTREDGKDWDMRLKQIQFAINSMENKTTKKSPHELLFAYRPRNALQNKLILALEDVNDEEINLEELRTDALKATQEQQLRQKQYYDKKHSAPRKYNEGDMVLIRRDPVATGQPRKLAPLYKGPYMVEQVLLNDRYLLMDIPGAERSQRPFHSVFPSDLMKPWCQAFEIEDNLVGSEAECDASDEGDHEMANDVSRDTT